METFAAIITLPIAFLNFGGGIVAGLWLLVAGQWVLVVSALISTIFSTWLLSFLMLPTFLLMAPVASARVQKSNTLIFILGALSNLWTYGLMLLYGVGSFVYVFNHYQSGVVLPYLLLAYSVATSPWTYMASGESRSNDSGFGTLMPVFGICVASIVMMAEVFFYGDVSFGTLVVVAGVPLALAWVVQMAIVVSLLKAPKKLEEPAAL